MTITQHDLLLTLKLTWRVSEISSDDTQDDDDDDDDIIGGRCLSPNPESQEAQSCHSESTTNTLINNRTLIVTGQS